jgi:hypothetical protein
MASKVCIVVMQSENNYALMIFFELFLTGKKGFGFYSRNKDFTVLLDIISNKCDVNSCLGSIKDLAEIRFAIGGS